MGNADGRAGGTPVARPAAFSIREDVVSDRDRKRDADQPHEPKRGGGAPMGNVPLGGQGGPTGADGGTTGGGADAGPGNVIGGAGGVGSRPPRPEDASDPDARGDDSRG
jgi:hypothetical protein